MIYRILALLFFCLITNTQSLAQLRRSDSLTVQSSRLRLHFNARGYVVGLTDLRTNRGLGLRAGVNLEGCTRSLELAQPLPNGGLRLTYRAADSLHSARVTEEFAPDGEQIRWTLAITGTSDQPWSTGIATGWWTFPKPTTRFWTTWGDPRTETTAGDMAKLSDAEQQNVLNGTALPANLPAVEWTDPLVPMPLSNRLLWYGGPIYGYPYADGSVEKRIYYSPLQVRNYFSVPMASLLDEAGGWGLTLGFAPDDLGIEATLHTDTLGNLRFVRHHNRIARDSTRRYTTYLDLHEADWRDGLGRYVRRFPAYFDPVLPAIQDFAGTGAYSYQTENFDAEKMRQMAFRTIWDATFPFLYMGQFLPPVSDQDGWLTYRGQPMSFPKLDAHYARVQREGFHILSYFNVTEFGNYIVPKRDYVRRNDDRTDWINPNKLFHEKLEPAVVYQPDDTTATRFIYTFEKTVVMDAAEPVFRDLLLGQARRHIERLPHFEGFAIDRMDWNRMYNFRRDDGLTLIDGRRARSLHTSWLSIMDTLGPLLHQNGKVLMINNHVKRLEQTRHADGIFDEFGYGGASLNANAFLTVRKPFIGWCANKAQMGDDHDAYMQRYLHLGLYPMAPFPANDHALLPDAELERLFTDYGPLFDALRGKQWVLEPGVVRVADGRTKVNVFDTPLGRIIPVTFGGDASSVGLFLQETSGKIAVEYLHVGSAEWRPLKVEAANKVEVPMKRGCALVRVRSLP